MQPAPGASNIICAIDNFKAFNKLPELAESPTNRKHTTRDNFNENFINEYFLV